MSKSFAWGVIFGTALLIVIGVSASRLQDKKFKDEKQYQSEVKDATPIRVGVMTEQQKKHSKIYTYYKSQADSMPTYKRISDLYLNPKGRVMKVIVGVGLSPLPEPETPEMFFGKLMHESDIVIEGTVIKKDSQITEDDLFIFTDYEIVVEQILGNNIAAPLSLGQSITVTRPGGTVSVNGIVVKAVDERFTPLPFNRSVILFLKLVPETGAYKATQYTGSFESDGVSVYPLTEAHLPPGVLQDRPSLLRTLRNVADK